MKKSNLSRSGASEKQILLLITTLLALYVALTGTATADQVDPAMSSAGGERAESPAATGFADVDGHLATLFKSYASVLAVIDKEHSAGMVELTKNYDSVLNRQMKFYQDGGSPSGALAVRRERQRIKNGEELTGDKTVDSKGELKPLAEQQGRFLEGKHTLEKNRANKIDSANAKLRDALEQYQSQLTRAGSLDQVEAVTKIADTVPGRRATPSSEHPLGPPTTQQELANYLEGTTWTWLGAKPAHAKFLPGQLYETSNDATGRVFGRWPYTITEDLKLNSPYKNKTFRFEFDDKFEKVEVFEEPGNAKIRYGKLETRNGIEID